MVAGHGSRIGTGAPDHFKLVRQQGYTWVYAIPVVPTPLHEAGFVTNGQHFISCNNVLENSNTVIESGDSDPMKWNKKTVIQGYGKTHLPLHMGNLPNSKYVYFTAWARPPLRGYIAKVSTDTWQILQKIDIGPDPHTCEPTIDGKHMTAVYSGNQGGQIRHRRSRRGDRRDRHALSGSGRSPRPFPGA